MQHLCINLMAVFSLTLILFISDLAGESLTVNALLRKPPVQVISA